MSDVGGPPGGFPAPPPWTGPPTGTEPRPRRRRRWPWVLGGVLVLIIGLGATGGTLFVQKIKPVIDASNEFLGDLDRGNSSSAFDQLCARDREDLDEGRVERFASLGLFEDYEINPFDVSINGDRATVGFDVEGLGRDEKLELPLRKERGDWRPCPTENPGFRNLL